MDMIFCDIGHGIGNLVHQAAYTYGCESRGIEMVGDRCDISKVYDDWFQLQHKLVSDRTGEVRTCYMYVIIIYSMLCIF
jgi:hypothetical protein